MKVTCTNCKGLFSIEREEELARPVVVHCPWCAEHHKFTLDHRIDINWDAVRLCAALLAIAILAFVVKAYAS